MYILRILENYVHKHKTTTPMKILKFSKHGFKCTTTSCAFVLYLYQFDVHTQHRNRCLRPTSRMHVKGTTSPKILVAVDEQNSAGDHSLHGSFQA